MSRRLTGFLTLVLACAVVLYFPIRRQLLDSGAIAAGTFAGKGSKLTLYDDGRYELTDRAGKRQGRFTKDIFPTAPWIASIRLDGAGKGLVLHVDWDDRAYRIEDVRRLTTSDQTFVKQ
jgi:hypothetical protein